ncbi:hypothetical protein V5F89_05100 [Pelagerythrobacter marensis]|uniref:Uncharacterized protein n=1 Tax=Pelagerythrobacter marensis TaxID=543877 RepID=A0ABZ2D7K9_9SPHN
MIRSIFPALALLAVSPALAQASAPRADVPLDVSQRTALRCSVAFALVAEGQARGDPAMAAFPQLGERGREFFVRTAARIMDQTGLDREAVAGLLAAELEDLRAGGALEDVMPPCLLLLDASGL